MVTPLEVCTREEQCSIIRFLGSERVNPSEIHCTMKMQYGDACLSLQQVNDWDRKFKSGVSSVADAARSGRPHTAKTPEMVAGVKCMQRENRRITLDEVVSELNISHGFSTPYHSQLAGIPRSACKVGAETTHT